MHVSGQAAQLTSLPFPLYHSAKYALSSFVRTLEQLEDGVGIRVVAVASGLIKTSIWTEAPEKIRMVTDLSQFVDPGDVSQKMVDLIEKRCGS